MGLAHSPKIVTDGLVFAIDTGNDKSYKGPVMTNIVNQITHVGTGTANGYSFTASTESVFIPTVGTMTAKVNSGFNNYPAVSTGCCPSLFYYGGLTVLPNTLYTYGILYKTTSGYSHPNFMYRYEYNNIGQYLTEQGVHSTTNRTHLGDGWYWAWGTFTTQPTAVALQTYLFYYNYGTATDKVYVADVMITQGNYTGLHPRYWPDVNTSRSNTSSVIDLTNRYTLTPTGLTYNSDGSFSFNGSSYIDLNSNNIITGTNPFTVESWYTTTGTTADEIFGNYGSSSTTNTLWVSGRYGVYINGTVYFPGAPLVAGTYHLAATRDSLGNVVLYKNGVQVNSGVLSASIPVTFNFRIGADVNGGSEPFTGKIYTVNVFNRVLTSQEIRQNFNALRGRFGI